MKQAPNQLTLNAADEGDVAARKTLSDRGIQRQYTDPNQVNNNALGLLATIMLGAVKKTPEAAPGANAAPNPDIYSRIYNQVQQDSLVRRQAALDAGVMPHQNTGMPADAYWKMHNDWSNAYDAAMKAKGDYIDPDMAAGFGAKQVTPNAQPMKRALPAAGAPSQTAPDLLTLLGLKQ